MIKKFTVTLGLLFFSLNLTGFQTSPSWHVYSLSDGINSQEITSAAWDRESEDLWIGFYNGQINRYRSRIGRWDYYGPTEGIPDAEVLVITPDEHYVWFGTQKGAIRFSKIDETFNVLTEKDGLAGRGIRDIAISDDAIWFAAAGGAFYRDQELITSEGGLSRLDRDTNRFENFHTADGLAGNDVFDINVMGKNIWIATSSGLSHYNDFSRVFKNYTRADGLPDDRIYSLAPDGKKIWLGTTQGIILFDPYSLEATQTFIDKSENDNIRHIAVMGNQVIIGTEENSLIIFNKTDKTWRILEQRNIVYPEVTSMFTLPPDLFITSRLGERLGMLTHYIDGTSGISLSLRGVTQEEKRPVLISDRVLNDQDSLLDMVQRTEKNIIQSDFIQAWTGQIKMRDFSMIMSSIELPGIKQTGFEKYLKLFLKSDNIEVSVAPLDDWKVSVTGDGTYLSTTTGDPMVSGISEYENNKNIIWSQKEIITFNIQRLLIRDRKIVDME